MASGTPGTTKPVIPSSMTSGTEPDLKAMTGVPQAMASIMTRPNGSGQSIGNSNAAAPARNCRFIIDRADELDLCPVDLRFKLFLEIFPFAPRHFCCDTKRHFGGMGNPNGGFRSFLRRQPAQESEVGAG